MAIKLKRVFSKEKSDGNYSRFKLIRLAVKNSESGCTTAVIRAKDEGRLHIMHPWLRILYLGDT